MALRAVIFDYGMVLTGLPNAAAYASMLRITGLAPDTFEKYYWVDRHDYDLGVLNGVTFWQKFIRDTELDQGPGALGQAAVEELNEWDARFWTTQNPQMLAWQLQLKQRGVLTGILSNMGDAVHQSIEREFTWIHNFDVQVWSYLLGIAKPDPAIYLYTLNELGVRPEESLFLDDKQVNIDAALALGMQALQFSNVEQLRADLIAVGLDAEVPLPG